MANPRSRYRNIIVKQGADFVLPVRYRIATGETPIDMSGYQYRGKIRSAFEGAEIASFVFEQIAGDSTYHGGFIAKLSNAATDLLIANVNTDSIGDNYKTATEAELKRYRLKGNLYRYDIESVSPSGIVCRELEGFVLVTAQITT